MNQKCDVAIIGSGFAGSILARILASRGRSVVLIDSATHPRFAIGESSTPIADLLLRRLGEEYGFPDLVELSCYGSWKRQHSELTCGMKRGFTYFDHRRGIVEAALGDRSMIVAASPTDERSDTHWYRSEVDGYLFAKATEAGVVGIEGCEVTGLDLQNDDYAGIRLDTGETLEADLIVDSSGAAAVSSTALGKQSLTEGLRTRSCTTFGHFRRVGSFSAVFNRFHGDGRGCDPFDADHAAQHHLIDNGWVWMLRFNNGITSVGISCPYRNVDEADGLIARSRERFADRFKEFEGLHEVLKGAELVHPIDRVCSVKRLQRLCDPVVSPRCLLMPTTAVTVDPLHSTGIAHGLVGVRRVAELILDGSDASKRECYREDLLAEAKQIDRLVSMAYESMWSFDRFSAACMVYFAAAIACEERIIADEVPSRLWNVDEEAFVEACDDCAELLISDRPDDDVIREVRDRIEPWNTAGLFDQADRRYAYTATK